MKNTDKHKITEAILVITTGFLAIYLIKDTEVKVFLYIAVGVGITGILIKPLAKIIAKLWYKLGDVLGIIVPKIVLTIIYFLILTPVALLSRLFKPTQLHLSKPASTVWKERNHRYQPGDLKNSW